MHLILSMPEGTEPEAVRDATRQFAQRVFGKNHDYVFALHTDTKSPHCHLTVKCQGHDGTRLNPRKADLQRWREEFADQMEQQGYMANATPRQTRGVTQKAERQVLRHIQARSTSQVQASSIKEAADELTAQAKGKPAPVRAWEQRIQERQAEIRAAWLAAAAALEARAQSKESAEKEHVNERPNYDAIRNGLRRADSLTYRGRPADRAGYADHIGAGQRVSVVLQPNPGPATRGPAAESVAGLRNVSRLDVVRNQGSSQVLLRENAHSGLGQGRGGVSDPAVRREGVGVTGAGSGASKGVNAGIQKRSGVREGDTELLSPRCRL
ncbi:hypothetical protein FUT48_00035 [Pseudomonas sp. JG-B]|nr:hypothetical protein [Pseudomonas sp. JG-B]